MGLAACDWPAEGRDEGWEWIGHQWHAQGESPPIPDRRRGEEIRFGRGQSTWMAVALPVRAPCSLRGHLLPISLARPPPAHTYKPLLLLPPSSSPAAHPIPARPTLPNATQLMWPFSSPAHLQVARRKQAAREDALRAARLRTYPSHSSSAEVYLRATGALVLSLLPSRRMIARH